MKGVDRSDLVAVIGLALVLAGITHWSVAAAEIVAGMVLVAFAYVTAKPKPEKKS